MAHDRVGGNEIYTIMTDRIIYNYLELNLSDKIAQ